MFFISKVSFLKSLQKKVSQTMQKGVCNDEVKSNNNKKKKSGKVKIYWNLFYFYGKKKNSQKSPREETGVYKSAASMFWSDVDIIVSFTGCQELLQNLCAFRGILGKGRENQHHSQCWEQSKSPTGLWSSFCYSEHHFY